MINRICPHCHSSKSLKVVKGKRVSVFSELGFEHKVNVYQCSQCGKTYIICSDCDGNGHLLLSGELSVCSMCHGIGLIDYSLDSDI